MGSRPQCEACALGLHTLCGGGGSRCGCCSGGLVGDFLDREIAEKLPAWRAELDAREEAPACPCGLRAGHGGDCAPDEGDRP